MFDDVRRALEDLLNGNVAPEDRRAALSDMRDTLVRAKMALDDLRQGIETTQKRLAAERAELETVRRRKGLAEGINDHETVSLATKYEQHHGERVTLFERKLAVQEGELALAEREIDEMQGQLKAANAGVGSGMRAGSARSMPSDAELGLGEQDPGLGREIDALDRAKQRAERESDADARLAELKRRMGR